MLQHDLADLLEHLLEHALQEVAALALVEQGPVRGVVRLQVVREDLAQRREAAHVEGQLQVRALDLAEDPQQVPHALPA